MALRVWRRANLVVVVHVPGGVHLDPRMIDGLGCRLHNHLRCAYCHGCWVAVIACLCCQRPGAGVRTTGGVE